MVTNITITNIKGYGSPGVSLDFELRPNRLNLLVAPNGFGKTSLATAISCLKPRKLEIADSDKYRKDATLKSELSMTIDGHTYLANNGINEISKHIYPFVIRGKLKPGTISHTHSGYTTTKSFLNIESIKVRDVHKSCQLDYSIRNIRNSFGTNGKILNDISGRFDDYSFTDRVERCLDSFEKYKSKGRVKLVEDIRDRVNNLKGSTDKILSEIKSDTTMFSGLEEEKYYSEAISILDYDNNMNSWEKYALFYQLCYCYKKNAANLRDVHKRRTYEKIKKNVKDTLSTLNSSWREINVTETKNELLVTYPHADEISNGQRDILTFVVQLIAFEATLPEDRPSLLVIDEIFDYLDDANMIAAQYYLSEFIKKRKEEIYVVVLTHVDSVHFRSYLTSKLLNVQTLVKYQPVGSPAMKAFVSLRENLDRNNTAEKQLYEDLSYYYFHYAPDEKDISAQIPAKENLRSTWGKDLGMHHYVIGECSKYMTGEQEYDPYAVCIGIRLRLEKMIYDSITSEDHKKGFIDTFETNKKMDYARKCGVDIPDAYYYLSAIHNEAGHLGDPNKDKACVYKLQHPVIKHIIEVIFDYKGEPLSLASIH